MKNKIFTLVAICLLITFTESNAQDQSEKLNYIENKGQWPENVTHMAKIGGGTVWLEKDKLAFNFVNQIDMALYHEAHHGHGPYPENIRNHSYYLSFIQSNPSVKITASKKSSSYHNYFLGSDPSKWASNVGLFNEVNYTELFPGINLRLHSENPYMKYDYIVNAGADVSLIKWKYEGTTPELKNGKIILNTTAGEVIEEQPIAWQIINGIKTQIECNYKLVGDVLQFDFPNGYESGYELIIDPTLIFSSYSGSTADNWGYSATYDDFGNLYSGSICFGNGYPIIAGAFQTNFAGGTVDASITKFNPTGTNLIYSTYLGGNSSDAPHSLIVDANNNLYVYGTTGSSNFPTLSGCYDVSYNNGTGTNPNGLNYNGSDIFITCFNSTGTALLGSTYVGGSQNDGLNDGDLFLNYGDYSRGEIILANNGDVLVGSTTFSANFPTTAGSHSQINAGGQEAVAFRLDASLDNLIWSTYLGGSGTDASYAVKESSNGIVYITGGTTSGDFPITSGSLQTTFNGGLVDGFVSSFNGTTGAQLNSTYLGTSSYDQCFLIEIDNNNDVYVMGQTKGTWPVSPGVYSNNNGRQFIHKLNPALNTTEFSTRFGSGGTEINISPTAFLVDNCYNIYVSGWGGTLNSEGDVSGMPVTGDAIDATTNGNDFYFIVLERDAASLLYGSFLGGNDREHVDGGTSRFDKNGVVYQAVCAGCGGNYPTTPGVWSPNNGSSNCNIGVFKMEFDYQGIVADASAAPNIIACDPPYDVNFTGSTDAVSHYWDFGDGSPTSTQLNPSHTYTGLGNFTVMYIATDPSTCNVSDTVYLSVQILQPEVFSADLDVAPYDPCLSGTYDVNLAFTGSGADSLIWNMGDGTIYNDSLVAHTYTGQGTYIISMTAYDFTCNLVQTITDTVSFNSTITTANANAAPNIIACDPPYDVTFTGSNNPDHIWDFGDGSPLSNLQNPSHTYTGLGNFTVMYIGIDSSTCNIADTVFLSVQILQPEVFSATLDVGPYDPCTGGPYEVNLEFTGSGADSLIWNMGDGNIYNDTVVDHFYTTDGTYIISLTAFDFTCGLMEIITDTVSFNSTNVTANANASPNVIACDPPFIVNYTGGTTPDHYWDFGDGIGTSTQANPSYTFTSIGSYTVMYVGIDSSTCNIADTVYLSVEVLEKEEFSATFSPIPPQPCSDTILVNVNFTGTGADSLIWNMGDGTIFTDNSAINYLYTIPGTYILSLTAFDFECGESGTITQIIEVADNVIDGTVFVPNIITPNNDNINDKFKLGYLEYPGLDPMGFMELYEIKIYNRWGKLIFESNSPVNIWNGEIDSDDASEGVYYYIINYQRECLDVEPNQKTGYVTVLRD
jgi:gliding motility-associated-like protein